MDWPVSKARARLLGGRFVLFLGATLAVVARAAPAIVINEIHYNPDVKVEQVEFVELYNAGSDAVYLAGWRLSGGIQYTFPPGALIAPRDYVVVGEHPAQFAARFGWAPYGPWKGKLGNEGDEVELRNALGQLVDRVEYQLGFPWPTVGGAPGHSIELVHPSLDNDLGGSWRASVGSSSAASRRARGSGPTPGLYNRAWATNSPPQMRQVQHEPTQPRSGQPVRITVKVTDPDGVSSVQLQYQIVEPGRYIALPDPAYRERWEAVNMADEGRAGDPVGGDHLYSVVLPARLQEHRRLIRYRIVAKDQLGWRVEGPYPDDPQPNFAYFVYDGVPSWTGSVQSGAQPFTVSAAEMGRLAVVHLISKEADVEGATWWERYPGSAYKWYGTLVYDGQVYDHIRYRARGGQWRYAMVKNMWKFRFNRGHELAALDNWGRTFKRRWRRLNLGASIQQGDYFHRGEQGMFESVGYRLFNLSGVEAPETVFCTLRIIDDKAEQPRDQYEGDFWGVYLMTEQIDGRFLDQHGLPDGNLYKMERGIGPGGGAVANQGPNQVQDSSDLIGFQKGQYNRSDQWLRDHLDLRRYFSYQTIVQAIHHYDISDGKNYYYFHNPETDKWQVHPWDIDLSWADGMYRPGVRGGNEPFLNLVLGAFSPRRPEIYLEFQARVRELRDLLVNPEQSGKLIDEYAALLQGPNAVETILDADRAKWDFNPKMQNRRYSFHTGKAWTGRFYQAGTPTHDFPGMVQLMKNYLNYRSSEAALGPGGGGLDGLANDPGIPSTPLVVYSGPTNFPVDHLSFRRVELGEEVAACQWRLASSTPTIAPAADPFRPNKYEIEADWKSEQTGASNSAEIRIPAGVVRVGETCRVRVRTRDRVGRWSHWSVPVEFIAGEPENLSALVDALRVTELMYHSPAGNEFDFLELHNDSESASVSLSGATFTDGIEFSFPEGTSLAPGEYLTLFRHADPAAFRAYYQLSERVRLAGPYSGNLSNGGERVTLRAAAAGLPIFSFEYDDGAGWPESADGTGHSLVSVPPRAWKSGGLDSSENWRASRRAKGSPGAADPGR